MQAKLLILISLFLVISINLIGADYSIDKNEYIVKFNDVFLIQTVTPDTLSLKVSVLPTGELNLFPVADTVSIAGKTLAQAYNDIYDRLGKFTKKLNVQVSLLQIAPISYTVSGAVNRAGEFTSKEPISLYQAIVLSGGLNSSAANELTIVRQNQEISCDIAKFFANGDPQQNPLIYHNDIIIANFAKESLKIYTNNDTLNYVESIVLDKEIQVEDAIKMLSKKYPLSNNEYYTLVRNSNTSLVTQKDTVKNGDKLIISQEDMYVYVVGSVAKPGRFAYNGAKEPIHYIGLAGGYTKDATRRSCLIIDKNGVKAKYNGQAINQGDTIFVPESIRAVTVSYLVPLSTVVSVISTIILLSRSL
ncbi:MAG: SLBB domain-containing protein [Candidatus Cloacimonetes bacterium]|nr:SLBB domain-containing protein [Candidatus Cloacimonadota bacterium]MDD3501431.1 SLBB domain-containing protein [Candidatus Cloacimonadota bacterium]